MELAARIKGLAALGAFLDEFLVRPEDPRGGDCRSMAEAVRRAGLENPWFTGPNVLYALSEIRRLLRKDNLEKWVSTYDPSGFEPAGASDVGVVMAGNLPMAGFHDFLTVLISGHRFTGKTSSRDKVLLPALAERLASIEPGFGRHIRFTDERINGCDAVIATGSNNTYRYFDNYFGKYPHVFRKNRNGLAVLTGKESGAELGALADDVFLYFGLGCRNVAKLLVPEGYDFAPFFDACARYSHVRNHHKYANNYEYQRSVHLMNRAEHLDNGFLLLRRETVLGSPVAVLFYDNYTAPENLRSKLDAHTGSLQCIVSKAPLHLPSSAFGTSQKPELWDYADEVDTLKFLFNLGAN